MNYKKIAWFLLICSSILLVVNIFNGYTNNDYNYWGIASNILLMLAMTISIYQKRTKG